MCGMKVEKIETGEKQSDLAAFIGFSLIYVKSD